jgi:hypothetical protein
VNPGDGDAMDCGPMEDVVRVFGIVDRATADHGSAARASAQLGKGHPYRHTLFAPQSSDILSVPKAFAEHFLIDCRMQNYLLIASLHTAFVTSMRPEKGLFCSRWG